mmetsp:Transcript_31502/g.65936  ORF Transcript_31502/g.65936 Transcript_31502/m.65936 type:complete len:220 (-) Transcript_31502:779-1438(-)
MDFELVHCETSPPLPQFGCSPSNPRRTFYSWNLCPSHPNRASTSYPNHLPSHPNESFHPCPTTTMASYATPASRANGSPVDFQSVAAPCPNSYSAPSTKRNNTRIKSTPRIIARLVSTMPIRLRCDCDCRICVVSDVDMAVDDRVRRMMMMTMWPGRRKAAALELTSFECDGVILPLWEIAVDCRPMEYQCHNYQCYWNRRALKRYCCCYFYCWKSLNW